MHTPARPFILIGRRRQERGVTMRIREVHCDVISWMDAVTAWLTTVGANGRQSRKQGDATRIDSLRCKTHRVVRPTAREHLVEKVRTSEGHNQDPLPTDTRETSTQRLLHGSLVHPRNTYHTSLRVRRRALDRIHPLIYPRLNQLAVPSVDTNDSGAVPG